VTALVLPWLLGALRVSGGATCPTPAEVERAISPSSSKYTATLEDAPGGVQIVLRDGEGNVAGERLLETSEPCSVRATAVAAILSAWEAQLETSALPPPQLPPPIPEPVRFEIAASVTGSVTGGPTQIEPGLEIRLSWARRESPWALVVGAWSESPRSFSLGPGMVRWQRGALGAGIVRSLRLSQAASVDLQAGLKAGFAALWGTGYDFNGTSLSFDAAACVGARLSGAAGSVRVFGGPEGCAWLRPQEVQVTGLAQTARLPQWELLLAAGVSTEAL
jgi:hypothetical protein